MSEEVAETKPIHRKPEQISTNDGLTFNRNFLREEDWKGLPYTSVKADSIDAAVAFYGSERILELLNARAVVLCKRQALSKLPELEGNDTEKAEIKEAYVNRLGEGDIIDVDYFDGFIPGDRPWTVSSVMKALKEAKKNKDKAKKLMLLAKLEEIMDLEDADDEEEEDGEE